LDSKLFYGPILLLLSKKPGFELRHFLCSHS